MAIPATVTLRLGVAIDAVTLSLGAGMDDLPGVEHGAVMTHFAERLLASLGIEVHLHDATVAIAEAAGHVLLHRDLRERVRLAGKRVDGARQAIRAADIEGVELEPGGSERNQA